jgi:hypothetical protein
MIQNWDRERFAAQGPITEEMAERSLATGANKTNVLEMMERIEAERTQVRSLVREEIVKMMKMGAEIAGMTYNSRRVKFGVLHIRKGMSFT